jgi:16S rRNA (guanine527-N7)-methyltransferase
MTSLSDYSAFFGRSEPEVAAALESFCAFLQRWNRAQNLVSRETSPALWQRHILDSLQMLPFLGDDCHILLDLGSGGGFPAVPVAIALKGTAFSYTLVEANARKASFLRACAREFALPVTVLTARAESLSADRVPIPDVITS